MTRTATDLWDRALAVLRDAVGEDEYHAWLAPISFEEYRQDSDQIVLSVASDFYQRWISRKYAEPIRAAFQETMGRDLAVEVIVRNPARALGGGDRAPMRGMIVDIQNPRAAAAHQLPPSPPDSDDAVPRLEGRMRGSPVQPSVPGTVRGPQRGEQPQPDRARLNPRYTFDEFVVGESNRYANAAAQSVADPRSQAFNPLFLYGQSGLGKTHLMQAIGHAYIKKHPGARVVYITSEQFINNYIESIQLKKSLDFRNQFRNIDLLMLDDVQFLMGKERLQHEVFHTFNALFDAGHKIVLTSDRPPKDLATLEDRLRSRFEWGVIADISSPDLETRIAILRHKARHEGLQIPSDVLTYIAERVKSNIRELEGALKRIKVYASLHECPITLEVGREVLSHLLVGQPQNRVTIEDIQRAVCDYFEITPQQLLGNNRSKKFSQPRHLALYLCRELTDLSFPDIAQKFGGKDHTSVIYACRKIKKSAEDDPAMSNIVGYLTKQIEKGQSAN